MNINYAARRAADAIGYDFLENPKPAQIETIKQMITEAIAAEFSSLQAELTRLRGLSVRSRTALKEDAMQHLCEHCGKEKSIVRPGKHECYNAECQLRRATNG